MTARNSTAHASLTKSPVCLIHPHPCCGTLLAELSAWRLQLAGSCLTIPHPAAAVQPKTAAKVSCWRPACQPRFTLLQLDQSARYNGKGASENYEAAVKALSDVVSFLA